MQMRPNFFSQPPRNFLQTFQRRLLQSPQLSPRHCLTRHSASSLKAVNVGNQAPASAAPNTSKTESQRKARQRAVAEEIGFIPTDPDTISSHEKKRHYLECLEHYVLYLHEQLRLVNTAPLDLERVSTYRGLSSRSIRTLLVHMQNTNRRLHENTLEEEQVFLNLSTEVMAAHGAGFPMRRHSVDVIDHTAISYPSDSANIGATTTGTRDGDRVFLGTGISLSGVDQRQLTSE
ncbi:uncharacterized protein BJ212DRAFT_318017 [Suillus subaureus]|uniref:Uncharacterized protein n=1 Tax=Suillus subaureus TaxID=48587 RepID=A0A9P7JJG3_9AGAM|nr:uncharacterized protein BJ212DRAFT_318017 [Suillus subaureus]KAG1826002.1 hypothetical protein BJ212DRAFT_318017 [Suillus subaureus]